MILESVSATAVELIEKVGSDIGIVYLIGIVEEIVGCWGVGFSKCGRKSIEVVADSILGKMVDDKSVCLSSFYPLVSVSVENGVESP